MSEFGNHLKQARESRGISLRHIATATKISPVALESLERGDLSKLPGGIFSRAFVRAYAIEVGLDPDETVAKFLVELGVHESRAAIDEVRPEVTADDRAFLEQQRRAAIALRIAIIVLIVLIIATAMAWRVRLGPSASASPAPQESARSLDAPPAMSVAAPAPVETPQAAAPDSGVVWIEVAASDSCWVQVTADGERRPGRVFGPGDRERFEAQREVVLQVGNAGVIALTVNGRAARPLGRIGEVRTVTISSATASQFYLEPGELPIPNASATDRP